MASSGLVVVVIYVNFLIHKLAQLIHAEDSAKHQDNATEIVLRKCPATENALSACSHYRLQSIPVTKQVVKIAIKKMYKSRNTSPPSISTSA